jgi:hypothetical protein
MSTEEHGKYNLEIWLPQKHTEIHGKILVGMAKAAIKSVFTEMLYCEGNAVPH